MNKQDSRQGKAQAKIQMDEYLMNQSIKGALHGYKKISNLRYADDDTLFGDSEEEIICMVIRVKSANNIAIFHFSLHFVL